MNLVCFGTGMYFSGRGTEGFGTIFPAILTFIKMQSVNNVNLILYYNTENGKHLTLKKLNKAQLRAGIKVKISFRKLNSNSLQEIEFLKQLDGPKCSVIALPDGLHFEYAQLSMLCGIHCLVVKPLTPSYMDSFKLYKLARKHKLIGQVEFHKRLDRQNQIIRNKILENDLGRLLYTWTEYSQRISIPTKYFKQWSNDTNIFQYIGVHYVDLVRYLTNARPVKVSASGQSYKLAKLGLDNFDSIQAKIIWETMAGDRFSQIILTNWVDPDKSSAMSDQTIKLVFENGRIEADQKKRGLYFLDNINGSQDINPDFSQSINISGKTSWFGYGIDSVNNFLNDVVNFHHTEDKDIFLLNLENNRPTFFEGIFSSSVSEAVKMSLSHNGKWTMVKLPSE